MTSSSTVTDAATLEAGRCYIRQVCRCHEAADAYMKALRADIVHGKTQVVKLNAMCDALAVANAKQEATIAALRKELAQLNELLGDRDHDLAFEYERANAAEKRVEELRDALASVGAV